LLYRLSILKLLQYHAGSHGRLLTTGVLPRVYREGRVVNVIRGMSGGTFVVGGTNDVDSLFDSKSN